MQRFSTEGLILHAIHFQDYDRILTLYTPDCGLIKAIAPGANRNKKKSPIEPFIQAEFVLTPRKSELLRCQEIVVLNRYLELRENFSRLTAACELLKAIQVSQLPHKPSPDLYKLAVYYMSRLSTVADPMVLPASFWLKILKHDGLLGPMDACSVCQSPLEHPHLLEGESFCHQHAPASSQSFLLEEIHLITHLSSCRTFADLSGLTISPLLTEKIKRFFMEQMRS